jgi:hypothetical protein
MIVPDWILYAWFALAALSTAYVAWDNFVHKNPEETVMKWGWVLITAYMGPIGMAPKTSTSRPGTSLSRLKLPSWMPALPAATLALAAWPEKQVLASRYAPETAL